eukprot:3499517-Pyramimonas_sp.AAC.1
MISLSLSSPNLRRNCWTRLEKLLGQYALPVVSWASYLMPKRTKLLLAFQGKGCCAARIKENGTLHAIVRIDEYEFEVDIVAAHRALGSHLASNGSMAAEITNGCQAAGA